MSIRTPSLETTPQNVERDSPLKKRIDAMLRAFSSIVLFGAVVHLAKNAVGAELLKDAPFLIQAARLEEYEGPMDIVVHTGAEHGKILGWSDEDERALEEQESIAFNFVEKHFGPPAPWTDNHVVLVVDAHQMQDGVGEGLAAMYSSIETMFPDLRGIYIVDTRVLDNVGMFIHELKHAWEDESQYEIPNSWLEGPAELARALYRYQVEGVDPKSLDEVLYYGKTYDELNTPELLDLSFSNKEKKGDAPLAYFMAGKAWYRWHALNPTFFIELAVEKKHFFEREGRPPTFEETKAMVNTIAPTFEDFYNSNYILQNANTD